MVRAQRERERLAGRPVGAAAGRAYGRAMPTTTPIEDLTRRAGTELPGGAALSLTLVFERAGGGKPVCVANAIYYVYE